MCYFLTISFKSNFENLVKSSFPGKVFLRENKNHFFKQIFGENMISLDITDGHCSCSIYPILLADNNEDETEKLVQKYRRKGWSENKIQRAIADSQKSQKGDFINLRQILAGIAGQIGNFRLFAHQYHGLIETENLRSLQNEELKASKLLDIKTEIPENVIVKIKK